MPEFVFANRAGLEMFETTSGSLQDLAWDKTLDEEGLKISYATFTQVLQQVRVAPHSKSSFTLQFGCRIRHYRNSFLFLVYFQNQQNWVTGQGNI